MDATPLALTVVTQSPDAWSFTLTVRVVVSDSPSPTENTVCSRLEVNPLQSDSWDALRVTVRSSSPVLIIVMSYSAASSVVAAEFCGLALRAMSAAAEAGTDANDPSIRAAMINA